GYRQGCSYSASSSRLSWCRRGERSQASGAQRARARSRVQPGLRRLPPLQISSRFPKRFPSPCAAARRSFTRLRDPLRLRDLTARRDQTFRWEGDRLMEAVRFDDYGGVEVLEVRDVARPEPGPGQVLVAVRAAGINPSEAAIRAGVVREIFPATFPSGQGSDLAGVVEEVGAGVKGIAGGDEVIGFTNNRASQAEYVLVEAANLTAKPAKVPWEVAGALFVADATGVATVRAVAPTAGEAVVIAGAGGGIGVFA